MALYRKNMGGAQQTIRLMAGAAIVAVALIGLTGPLAWTVAIGGAAFAGSGLVGYCPMCAVAGIGRKGDPVC